MGSVVQTENPNDNTLKTDVPMPAADRSSHVTLTELRRNYAFGVRQIEELGAPDLMQEHSTYGVLMSLYRPERVREYILANLDEFRDRHARRERRRETSDREPGVTSQASRERRLSRGWRTLLRSNGNSEALALAEGVWLLNKLAKLGRWRRERWEYAFDRDRYYRLKDRWIAKHQHLLTEGEFTRIDWRGRRGRALYCHSFEVEGRRFCFHSYREPSRLSNPEELEAAWSLGRRDDEEDGRFGDDFDLYEYREYGIGKPDTLADIVQWRLNSLE